MQEGDVARIDAAFHGLQPVALLQPLRGEGLLRRHHREFPLRQRRLVVGRPHIGPQHVADLHQRVGGQLDLLAEAALNRLGRHVHALPIHIVFPAVIGAAQAGLLVAAEPQRHPAMGAKLVDQAIAAFQIAEGDQAFGEKLDPDRRAIVFRQFLGQQRRQPVATEQLAHGGPGAGLGQKLVLFFSEHDFSSVTAILRNSRDSVPPRQARQGTTILSHIMTGRRNCVRKRCVRLLYQGNYAKSARSG